MKVFAVLGDYYHKGEWAKAALDRAVAGNVHEIIEVRAEELKDWLAEQPDAVILFKENRLNPQDEDVLHWMTEETEIAITDYVANGGGWLAWHAGLASYNHEGEYIGMLRGSFDYHPQEHQIVSYKQTENSPFPAPEFELTDEHYFVHCDTDQSTVFLESESVDGSSIAGWYHTYGDGHVCCLTPAHNQEGLLNPYFLQILGECVQWTLKRYPVDQK
ncbi:ThuA domain-containing protein [Fictibacillus fluitans]|uniref:ThuA domain-containing protein n=1 Tax=Fictibacillus fluitans TaxID=3058422 RepID=A0ABT8HT36_9BACL|nr:ThuA domain-containing protein [Fictibacillus sp. NE201]MDN4523938.1 ThuA domain-containing protein [Fictibacillus sp. NE201]